MALPAVAIYTNTILCRLTLIGLFINSLSFSFAFSNKRSMYFKEKKEVKMSEQTVYLKLHLKESFTFKKINLI